MYASYVGVVGVGCLLDRAPYGVVELPLQVLPYREISSVKDEPILSVGERLGELRRHLLTGLAVDRPPLAPLYRVDGVLAHPPAVLAAAYAALAVTALTHLRRFSLPVA